MTRHLPQVLQHRFRKAVDLLVAEPWSQAALEAKDQGRPAPSRSEVEAAAIIFFEEILSIKVLDVVHEIGRGHGSCYVDEERSELDSGGPQEKEHSAALEYCKMLCYLIGLEPQLLPSLSRLRRNLFKFLGVREFAVEARLSPSIEVEVVLPDFVCEFCGHCRDFHLSRETELCCECCEAPHNHGALEHGLVQLVQHRAASYQGQDQRCVKCMQVKRCSLSDRCEFCAGAFELKTPGADLGGLETLMSFAVRNAMPWLAEVVKWPGSGGC